MRPSGSRTRASGGQPAVVGRGRAGCRRRGPRSGPARTGGPARTSGPGRRPAAGAGRAAAARTPGSHAEPVAERTRRATARAGRGRGTAPRARSAPSPPPTRRSRRRQVRRTCEQVQHVQQHADVAAGDDQRRRRVRGAAGTSSRCRGDRRRAPRAARRRRRPRWASRTRARCCSSRSRTTASASASARLAQPRSRAGAPGDLVQRAAAHGRAARGRAPAARRSAARCSRSACGVLRVALQHVQPAARAARGSRCGRRAARRSSASSGSRSCQPAVTVATGPAGSSVRTTGCSVGRRCGPSSVTIGAHAACTCTVRPTSSSMPRSTS